MAHDQLFKELLRAFFAEFMELFFPTVAEQLDFSAVVFLDKEVFTDVPAGSLREPDLIARVQTTIGEPEIILIHIEVQARREREFGARMAEYYMLLRLRYRLPVFPVALYLERGAGGVGTERYRESLFDWPVLTFNYHRIGVPDLAADEYLQGSNPLAYGLAALMRPGERRPAEVKADCLLRVARAVLDEARKVLLANCVETYLHLDAGEQQRFQQLIDQSPDEEVSEMLSIYEERGITKGKRDAVLRTMRHKFGELPEPVRAQVQAIESDDELNELLDAILDASSLDALPLGGKPGNGSAG